MYKGRNKTNRSPLLNNVSNDNSSSHRLKRRLDAPKMSFYIRILIIGGQDRRKTCKEKLKIEIKRTISIKKGHIHALKRLTLIGNIDKRQSGKNSE